MENNKILISVRFKYKIDNIDKDGGIELIVLRDATLNELFEGIEYGLARRAESKSPDADLFKKYQEVFGKFKSEKIKKEGKEEEHWKLLLLTFCDKETLKKNEKSCHIRHIRINNRNEDVEDVFLKPSAGAEKLCDLGIISATRLIFLEKESPLGNASIPTKSIYKAFKPQENDSQNINQEYVYPKYNISSRQLRQYDLSPIDIIPPQGPPQKPKQNLFAMLLPSILSVVMMVFLQNLLSNGSGGGTWFFTSVGMGFISAVMMFISWWYQKREYENNLYAWKDNYQNYIKNVIEKIKQRQEAHKNALSAEYPQWETLKDSIFKLDGDLFNRSPENSDFLTVSLGKSDDVKNLFKIEGKQKDEIFSSAYFKFCKDKKTITVEENKSEKTANRGEPLSSLPARIAEEYANMKDAPYLYSFKNSGTLGIVCESSKDSNSLGDRLVRTLIFKLCYYHSPENLQFVMFFPTPKDSEEKADRLKEYLYLPHCRELFENKSQFVFSRSAANSVLGNMLKMMEARAQGTVETRPHIVFVVFDEYDLKEHAFAKYLPTSPVNGGVYSNDLGLSFIFVKDYKHYLPEYCTDIIELNKECANIISYNDKDKKVKIRCDIIPSTERRVDDDEFQKQLKPFSFLSSLYYTRISQNRRVPSNISLFDLWKITETDELKKIIRDEWGTEEDKDGKQVRKYDITKTLAVPIGEKGGDEKTFLDLHEREDGPHMLVAGTTGSGKSETILSYLIGLAMRYRPDEVNLLLVDMKGGGFTKRLKGLPHVVGKVTDIDGDENNTGAEYMLKRFLVAIKDEIKYRKRVINHFDGVDSADGYIKKCREIAKNEKASAEDKAWVNENTLGHLILVIDEFTELKRFSTQSNGVDYMSEITTIARIGRSLGIHIILISQNIEGAINDDIRVNAKSRLCLKVATRQASNEMIGNTLAAEPSMPGNGRAYLLVGTGSKFEYFQSAYSGASAPGNDRNDNISQKTDLAVTYAKVEGEYELFYRAFEDHPQIVEKRKGNNSTQLDAVVKAIIDCYDNYGEDRPRVRRIFSDPLPQNVVYPSSDSNTDK